MQFVETKRGVKEAAGRNRGVTVELNITLLHMMNRTHQAGYRNTYAKVEASSAS
jgi:hypothetical protein